MAHQSLAAKGGLTRVESNPGVGLPIGFASHGEMEVAEPIYQATPYVQFVSPKGKTFAQLYQHLPTIEEGDPVLVRPSPAKPAKLDPFRFYLVHAWQHYSEVDSTGNVLRTVTDQETARKDNRLKEHVETVVLVLLDGDLIPARCTFKTTKVNAPHAALAAIAAQRDDLEGWLKTSPEHKETAAIPDPRFRFTTLCRLRPGVGRATGFKYVAASGVVQPTTLADWKLLGAKFQDAEFRDLCDRVAEAHEFRKAQLKSKV